MEALQGSGVPGDVLLNTTSVGMHPAVGESPASREAAGNFRLVSMQPPRQEERRTD